MIEAQYERSSTPRMSAFSIGSEAFGTLQGRDGEAAGRLIWLDAEAGGLN